MSEQTNEPVPGSDLPGGPSGHRDGQIDLTGSASRSLGMQQCPNCGAKNHASASVCLACGEQLRQRPKKVRCRQCGQQASSSLTICPNCGRELQAAPSRFWTWVVPLGIVVLVALIWLSRSSGPVSWAEEQADKAVSWVTGMGAEMDPHMTIVTTPDADTPVLELVSTGAEDTGADVGEDAGQVVSAEVAAMDPELVDAEPSEGEVVALLPTNTAVVEPSNTPTDAPTIAPTIAPTETPTALPTSTPTPTLTATVLPTSLPTSTSTALPTESPRATSTSQPSSSPTPTSTVKATATKKSTATPAGTSAAVDDDAGAGDVDDSSLLILEPTAVPDGASDGESGAVANAAVALLPTATTEPTTGPDIYEYTVQSGDTLLGIAQRFGVSVEALMAANDIAPNEAYALSVGETLKIMSDDDAPVSQTYTVRPGDTFVVIASRFDISAAALQSANGFTDEQVRLLRPGQELIIPLERNAGSSSVALAPTATPAPTATSIPTVIPTATPSPLRLDAPALRSPENNTVVSCQSTGQLAWGNVNFVMPTDEFVMHLGFVSSLDAAGGEGITWVLNQRRPSNRTSWEMDPDLCGLAPQEFGRQWRWYVDIVDEEGEPVSAPSETWGFSWN